MSRLSKSDYFLALADTVRLRSRDPKTQVGAVLVDEDDRVVSTGYNGFVKGYADGTINWSDREFVYARVVHAEMNAILYAGGRYDGSTLYVTLSPCKECIKLVAAAGIKTVIFRDRYKDYDTVEGLAKEFGVHIVQRSAKDNG